MDKFDFKIYLNEIKTTLIKAKNASKIKKTIHNMELTLNYYLSNLDDNGHYQKFSKIRIDLAVDLLANPYFFLKKYGSQYILPSTPLAISPSEKSRLLQVFIKNYSLYESSALCWAICNFIYYEINDYDPKETLPIYKQLLETKPTKEGISALNSAFYFNCNVHIDSKLVSNPAG